jgi:hypothetical protein
LLVRMRWQQHGMQIHSKPHWCSLSTMLLHILQHSKLLYTVLIFSKLSLTYGPCGMAYVW